MCPAAGSFWQETEVSSAFFSLFILSKQNHTWTHTRRGEQLCGSDLGIAPNSTALTLNFQELHSWGWIQQLGRKLTQLTWYLNQDLFNANCLVTDVGVWAVQPGLITRLIAARLVFPILGQISEELHRETETRPPPSFKTILQKNSSTYFRPIRLYNWALGTQEILNCLTLLITVLIRQLHVLWERNKVATERNKVFSSFKNGITEICKLEELTQ